MLAGLRVQCPSQCSAIGLSGYSEIEIEGVSFGEFLAADGDFQEGLRRLCGGRRSKVVMLWTLDSPGSLPLVADEAERLARGRLIEACKSDNFQCQKHKPQACLLEDSGG